MRALYKAPWATSIILWHIFSSWVVRLFARDPLRLRAFFLRQVHRRARQMARAIDLELVVEGRENMKPGHNYLMVGNHLSYLDAVIVASLAPVAFVTSMEMRAVPVLGLITELGGCLYVDRKSKTNIHNEISGMVEALRQGFHVVIFPEATSTNGSKVLGFKRPLFAAALHARKNVLPIVIQYEELDGAPVTAANRDALCWYGDMGFGPHFLKLTSHRSLKVRLKILPEIPVTEATERDRLMEESFAVVSGHYRPIA